MRRAANQPISSWIFLGVIIVLVGSALVHPGGAVGQTAGNNAVYNSSGNCSSCGFSSAFVDATPLGSASTNICSVLNAISTLSNHYLTSNGAVIDARGLPFTTPATSMTCPTTQPSPW